jgi:hypothetical protein
LQQIGVESAFVFSGHYLSRWPPYIQISRWVLAFRPDMAKVLADVALRKANLRSV